MTRPLGSRYELTELLARGASGAVWRAVVRGTDAEVAVKLLRDDLARAPDVVDRFLRERHVLTALRHPGIVRVRDLVAEGDDLGMVMDLVEGVDLRRHLAVTGPVAPAWASGTASTVASALAASHAAGIVHGDVKPANILVPRDGGPVRLADFGVARLLRGPAAISYGTPEYVAPEVVAGHASLPGTDVYGLGIVLYEMLVGATPYRGGTPDEVMWRHLTDEPMWVDAVPAALRPLLGACLDRDPAERPVAAEVAAVLGRVLPSLVAFPAAPRPADDAVHHRPATARPPAVVDPHATTASLPADADADAGLSSSAPSARSAPSAWSAPWPTTVAPRPRAWPEPSAVPVPTTPNATPATSVAPTFVASPLAPGTGASPVSTSIGETDSPPVWSATTGHRSASGWPGPGGTGTSDAGHGAAAGPLPASSSGPSGGTGSRRRWPVLLGAVVLVLGVVGALGGGLYAVDRLAGEPGQLRRAAPAAPTAAAPTPTRTPTPTPTPSGPAVPALPGAPTTRPDGGPTPDRPIRPSPRSSLPSELPTPTNPFAPPRPGEPSIGDPLPG